MRVRGVVLVALVAAGLAACGGGGSDPWTLEVSGAVALVRDGAETRLNDGEHEVETGDRLHLVDGRAVLTLPHEASLELREGTVAGAAASALRVAAAPELLAGEMLLVADSRPASAVAGAATLRISDGALRVRRGASVTVGVYSGEAELEANGRSLQGLRPLRQATITDSGALPRELQPVSYDRRSPDPWDRRFLGDAIDLDLRIEPLQAAVAQNAERTVLGPIIVELAGPVRVDDDRSPGEAVVGAAITSAATDDAGEAVERWDEVFAFRDAGAPWGVVALDQEADRGEVLDSLGGAVRQLVQRFGGVAAGRGAGDDATLALPPLAGDDAGSTPPPSDDDDGDDDGDDDDGDGTPPTTSPPTTEPPLLPLPDLPLLPGDPDSSTTDSEEDDPKLVHDVIDVLDQVTAVTGVVDGLLGTEPQR